MRGDDIRLEVNDLGRFCREVFVRLGLSGEDAAQASDVLVAADRRGIPSHGVSRLWRYVNGLKTGLMDPSVATEVLTETPMSLVVHAHGAMGAPVSVKTMAAVIRKAETAGAAFGVVRDSNHFGIAAYYAMMALEKDMIGIAMTNTAALGVPTFGRQVMFGTNPLAFAAPADRERAFVLDMSTTVVTRGKIEVYERAGKPLPLGWAVDKTGGPATDARGMLEDMFHRHGGGILPLGGAGEEFSGYKGYGLAVMVDILCAVLGGAPTGPDICDTATSSARVSHFFGAIRVGAFREPSGFRADMDRMLARLRLCPPAEGQERVYFAGQKEFEQEQACAGRGVPLQAAAYDSLLNIAREVSVPPPNPA
jgi:L-2-hydroxycarboxylate dehydrogenase (NAD+)